MSAVVAIPLRVTWTGQGFPPDRETSTSFQDRTWEEVEGSHPWNISMPILEVSEGTSLRTEGVDGLGAKISKGQMFKA